MLGKIGKVAGNDSVNFSVLLSIKSALHEKGSKRICFVNVWLAFSGKVYLYIYIYIYIYMNIILD